MSSRRILPFDTDDESLPDLVLEPTVTSTNRAAGTATVATSTNNQPLIVSATNSTTSVVTVSESSSSSSIVDITTEEQQQATTRRRLPPSVLLSPREYADLKSICRKLRENQCLICFQTSFEPVRTPCCGHILCYQ